MGNAVHRKPPPIETLTKDGLGDFIRSTKVGLLLVGTSAQHSFLVPVVHHFTARCGDGMRYAYLRLQDLGERGWVLHLLRGAFFDEPRRLRAARTGYYLLAYGTVIGFHPGLYDRRFNWSLVEASHSGNPADTRPGGGTDTFRRYAMEAAHGAIDRFEQLLSAFDTARQEQSAPYQLLGLRSSASLSEVKTAYRREMMRYHPDRQLGRDGREDALATERAKLIIRAYHEILRQRQTAP